MELVETSGMTGGEFLSIWLGFGFLSWILFVVFIGRVLGHKEFRRPYMKRAGAVTLGLMASLGFLSIPIIITVAIPFFESFIDPDLEEM